MAHAGVAIVTCMDSRIVPLDMLGLGHGDAKIFRNPGGRVTPQALEALVLGVHLLGVDRILVVPHTRCAMASVHRGGAPRAGLRVGGRRRVAGSRSTSSPTSSRPSPRTSSAVRSHPLIPDRVKVGGFLYDVDTGRLTRHV